MIEKLPPSLAAHPAATGNSGGISTAEFGPFGLKIIGTASASGGAAGVIICRTASGPSPGDERTSANIISGCFSMRCGASPVILFRNVHDFRPCGMAERSSLIPPSAPRSDRRTRPGRPRPPSSPTGQGIGRLIPAMAPVCAGRLVTADAVPYSFRGGAVVELLRPVDRKGFAMRKMILTGALFARLTRKDRLTLPYAYY